LEFEESETLQGQTQMVIRSDFLLQNHGKILKPRESCVNLPEKEAIPSFSTKKISKKQHDLT